MPLYDFRCDECFEEFEELLTNPNDREDLECPRCRGKKISQLISGFAMPSSGGGSASLGSSSASCGSGPFR
jgi:putative FmdB family regulatory protein